jgi:hypothetical protein
MKQNEDLQIARKSLERTINSRYKPEPEWEDKHPILATLLILAVLLLNPISLFIIGMFGLIITLILTHI